MKFRVLIKTTEMKKTCSMCVYFFVSMSTMDANYIFHFSLLISKKIALINGNCSHFIPQSILHLSSARGAVLVIIACKTFL